MANKINIKRGIATVVTVSPLTSSKAELEEQVTLSWEQATKVDVKLGDFIMFDGLKYTLNELPTVKKSSSRLWRYDAIFQAPIYDLLKVSYMFPATGADARGDFPLTGTPDVFMNLLVENLGRVFPGVFSVGSVIEGEAKTISFSEDDNCLTALSKVADEYKTEFSLSGYAVNLNKVTRESPLTLEYGSTLYDVERKSIERGSAVTRLRAFGSRRNIPADYRGGYPRLMLPEPLQYVERGVAEFGIIEGKKNFDDIYPRLASGGAGVITAVVDMLTFTDTALDFDINGQLLPGTPAKVKFLTGQCAGYECEIQRYTHSDKKIVVIPNKDDKGFEVPNASVQPAVGDKYVLLDINMPESYRTAAENELKTEAEKWLEDNPPTKCEYSVTFSDVYARTNSADIRKNDMVPFIDSDFGINESLRVVKVTKSVAEPWNIKIDISNTIPKSTWESLLNDVATNEQAIADLQGGLQQSFARNWLQVEELSQMIETLHTEMLVIGNMQGQFTLNGVLFYANYSQNANQFYATAGTLIHTMVPTAENPKNWTMQAYNNSSLASGTAYYLYARCGRNTTNGTFVLSSTAREWDGDPVYYYFLVGVLSSVYDGARCLQTTYGFTQITGNQVVTGRVASRTGKTYFDLDQEVVAGDIKFIHNGSETDLGGWASQTEGSITSAQLLVLSSTSQVMPCDANNVPLSAQTITFEAKLQHLTGVASFTAVAHTSGGTHNLTLGGSGNRRTLTSAQWATTYIKIVVTASLGGQSDTVTIYRNNEGQAGATGAAGQGIDSVTDQFYLSTSKTQPQGGSWQETPPTWQSGKYMWTRAKIVYKNPYAVTYTEPLCDSSWEAVFEIEIGGGNLLNNTDYTLGLDGVQSLEGSSLFVDTYGRLVVRRENANHRSSVVMPVTLLQGRNYILGVDEWWRNGGFITLESVGTSEYFAMEYFKEESLPLENGRRKYYKITPTKNITGRLWITSQFGGGVSEFRIKRPMLEEATHASNYNPNYEDNSALLSNTMAMALQSKAVTDGFTAISGGLISTVLILLRSLAGIETAGISGQQQLEGGMDRYAPAFWSGGTAAQAANFSLLMQKYDAGTLTNADWDPQFPTYVVLHNGHAKMGGFVVTRNDKILMFGNTKDERFSITNGPITNFEMATSGTSNSGYVYNGTQQIGTPGTVQLPNTMLIPVGYLGAGVNIRFECKLKIYNEVTNPQQIIGANIKAELYRGNTFVADLGGVSVVTGTAEQVIDTRVSNVTNGLYNVKLTYTRGSGSTGYGYIYNNSKLSWEFTAGTVRRTELGIDGLMVIGSLNHIYYDERGGMDVRGKTNIPGVLLSARVKIDGSFEHSWGAKKHPTLMAERVQNYTGRYKVYHSVGHTSYHVAATPATYNRSCHVMSKYNDYFLIEWRTIGGTPAVINTAFDFIITGDNYTPAAGMEGETGRT